MGGKALECTLCGARSRWLAPLIAFLPKPRSGGWSAAEGLGKKAILSFADVSKKKTNGIRCGGKNFELVYFQNPFAAVRSGREGGHGQSITDLLFA